MKNKIQSKSSLHLLFALILGAALGTLLHGSDSVYLKNFVDHVLGPIGQIFLRLIFMVVVPLIFSALILGVRELGSGDGLRSIAKRTMIWTLVASAASVVIGMTLVTVLQPGKGLQFDRAVIEQQSAGVERIQKNAEAAKSISQVVVDLFTRNPIDSAARALDGEIVALMIFGLIFGLGLNAYKGDQESKLVGVIEEILGACMKMVGFAMRFAPMAVFALVFQAAFRFGFDLLQSLLFYVFVVVLGLLIQQFVVYGGMLKFAAKRSPLEFFKNCKDVYLYAFSTASSNATLPKTLETAEVQLGLPRKIARFVLTVGSTANQNGTALFEGVTVLFLAQVYGVELSFVQQITVLLISILAGIGTAGVPGGSLPPMMILMQSVGVPAEGIGLILGVDRFLDMARTTINVSGDLVITACVAEGEKAA